MLREANEFQEPALKLPKQKIMDQQELVEYKGEKRKEFEDKIRRNRTHVGHWLKYAAWEESQHEYERYVESELSILMPFSDTFAI